MVALRVAITGFVLLLAVGLFVFMRPPAMRSVFNTGAKAPGPGPEPRDAALINAINAGDAVKAQSLLTQGASANARDYTNRPHRHGIYVSELLAIIVATQRRDLELVQILLKHGADANARTKSGETVLRLAAGQGDTAIMESLLAHGANVNSGMPLTEAAIRGHATAVQVLLKHKADPNAKDATGKTALQWATERSGNGPVAQVLQGRPPRIIPPGHTPLTEAAHCGGVTRMKALIAAGADVNAPDGTGSTPLMAAARYGHESPLQRVFTRGAEARARHQTLFGSVEGRSASVPLQTEFEMILKRRAAMIEVLFDPKSRLKIKGGRSAATVFQSALSGDSANLSRLLAQGADPDPHDAGGFTPLMAAATLGDASTIKILLGHGANKQAKDGTGRMAKSYLPFSSNVPIEAERLLI